MLKYQHVSLDEAVWGSLRDPMPRFARHVSPLTTIIYTHPSDEELYAGVRDLPC